MRKSRLVILPTKCLNQIGFLLLFLSCPVLGDWGRIQPESEASHNAIQIARKGTCGLQRDIPGGDVDSFEDHSFKHRQNQALSIDENMAELSESPISPEKDYRKDVRGTRITDGRRENSRMMGRRQDIERRVSSRRTDEIRRSRSLERSGRIRTDAAARSLSLSRLNTIERETRTSRRISQRARTDSRLSLVRKTREGVQQDRESRNYRRESERMAERRDAQGERTRKIDTEKRVNRQNRESTRRINDAPMNDNLRRIEREKTERRLVLDTSRRTSEREQNLWRDTRGRENQRRKAIDNERRVFYLTREVRQVQNAPERLIKRVDTRFMEKPVKAGQDSREDYRASRVDFVRTVKAPQKDEENNELIRGGYLERIGIKNYDGPTWVGSWTLNCVIGAVAYYIHGKQAKVA